MGKRIFAGILWFLSIGMVWNAGAFFVGFSTTPGLLLACIAFYLVAVDPLKAIWQGAIIDSPQGTAVAGAESAS